MKTIVTLLLLAASAVSTCAQPAAGIDEATAAIDKLRDGLVKSFVTRDVEGLLKHLDTDVLVTWQNGEVCRGHDQVRAFYSRMMTGDKKVVNDIKSAPVVHGRILQGDVAISWGNLNDHFLLTDGSDLPFNSVFTATTVKRGDRWLVSSFHASINAFENPIVGFAVRKTALWTGGGAGVLALIVGFLIGRRRSK